MPHTESPAKIELMNRVTIKYFKEKHQERITFVRALVDFQVGIGLKRAKELLDKMLDGEHIQYNITDDRLQDFLAILEELNLEYEVN